MRIEVVLGALLASIVSVELTLRSSFLFVWASSARVVQKAVRGFIHSTTDDDRQRQIFNLSLDIFVFSAKGLLFLVLIASAALAPLALIAGIRESTQAYLIYLSVFAVLYAWLRLYHQIKSTRKSLESTGGAFKGLTPLVSDAGPLSERRYQLSEEILHWIVLEPRYVRRLLFSVEQRIFRKSIRDIQNQSPAFGGGDVYVCGLARSGTTMVLELLHGTGAFASLLYKDMPFVMSPNLWATLRGKTKKEVHTRERAHGDQVLTSTEHPEAFEEVFWESFRDADVPESCFDNPASEEAREHFRRYRLAVVRLRQRETGREGLRYLSKNNNNLLRLGWLAQEADSKVLIVYRDPLSVARSLFKQHIAFTQTQQDDPFIRKYMHWLAHHEFGLDQSGFCFARQLSKKFKPISLDYWLAYWIDVHQHIVGHAPQHNVYLVHYNQLCSTPKELLAALAAQLNVGTSLVAVAGKIRPIPAAREHATDCNQELVSKAEGLYQTLQSLPNNCLHHQAKL